MTLPFPHSKNHLLSVVDTLTYTERFNYASRLGRDHKAKPALRTLVDDLLKHPDPPAPEMEAEEGFTEILPAQRTSIAKYYNEDQLALAIAVSAGFFDLIKERLTSPSTFFDNLVFSNYVRMKKERKQGSGKNGAVTYYASDEEIAQAILAAVPARRRLLIQETIQAKRLSVIAKVLPELRALPNYPAKNVAHIIHACDSETVKNFLFEAKFKQVGQVWNKIMKFHIIALLELLEEDLEAAKPLDRNDLYSEYYSWAFTGTRAYARFTKNKVAMEKFLDILLKYPPVTWEGPDNEQHSAEIGKVDVQTPYILKNAFEKFMLALPEKTTQVMLARVWLHHDGKMNYNRSCAWEAFSIRAGYSYINRYIKRALEITPENIKLASGQPDYEFIGGFFGYQSLKPKWNTHQTLYVLRLVVDYMLKHKTDVKSDHYKLWTKLWKKGLKNATRTFEEKFEAIYSRTSEEKISKANQLTKKLDKYNKAIVEIFDIFFPSVFEEVYRDLQKTQSSVAQKNEIKKINATLDTYRKFSLERTTEIPVTQYVFEKTKENLVRLIATTDPKEKADARSAAWNFIQKLLENVKKSQESAFVPEQKEISLKDLVHMAKNKSSEFISMITVLPIQVISEAVTKLLSTPNSVDENTRNSLISFQDITDIKIRNSLQKMANSSSEAERNGAIKSLVMATARSNDKAQQTLTLKFIREKIQNKPKQERADILEVVRTEGQDFLFPKGAGQEQFAIWHDMLTDALESPDLDKAVYDKSDFNLHPVLKFFNLFATAGFDKCVEGYGKNFDPAIFEFSSELLWRLTVFRHGEKKAAQELFRIKFDTDVFKKESEDQAEKKPLVLATQEAREVQGINKLLPHYVAAYEKRIAAKNPDWKEDYNYFSAFISFVPKTWPQIPDLAEVVRAQIARIKEEANKDDDGLYIIPPSDKFNNILTIVEDMPNKLWEGPVAEVVDLTMHSRLATKLLSKWVGWREEGAKTAKDFKERRDKYVPELLKISPSAIHLRFVWQHLVTYMQNKLDEYIGKRKTFRGVFYVGPEQRKFERSCIKTPQTRRSGGRVSKKEPAKNKHATKAGVITQLSDNPQKQVEDERKKEKKIQKELRVVSRDNWDHEDFFYLEACYGLKRLLPRQVNLLAKDWEVQALNEDRAIPHRVKCTARWTVMPTTSYNDVVVFLNAHEQPSGQNKGLSVNLIESLLRGVMQSDEPIAPLNFLLSPKFLSTARSRASVYAITQSIPYMPQDGLTSILKLCLTGKLRQQLKVSSYKEIIRLLASIPTDEHLDIILREWKRTDLHRDLRIAVVVSAIQFLHNKDEKFNKIAWQILEKAASLDEPEILTALLGTKEEHTTPSFNLSEEPTYFSNSRIIAHLKAITKRSVPSQHAKRFGEKVVGTIASSATNDDIKFLAIGSLQNWPVLDLSLELTQKYLLDFSTKSLLYSDIPSKRQIYERRWKRLVAKFESQAVSDSANCQKIIQLATALCAEITSIANPERVQRVILVGLAKDLISSLPDEPYDTCQFQPGEEEQLLSVFKEKLYDVFAEKILGRNKSRLERLYWSAKKPQSPDPYIALLHDATVFAASYPTASKISFYSSLADSMIYYCSNKRDYITKLMDLILGDSIPSDSYGYKYLLYKVALDALSKHKEVFQDNAATTLKLWEKIFNFAEERKDIPREHQYASNAFDVETFGRHIDEILRHEVEEPSDGEEKIYPKGAADVIRQIATRYLAVVKGENQAPDAFAEQIGLYLLKNSTVISDAAPEQVVWQMAQSVIICLAFATNSVIVPKMVRDVESANRTALALSLYKALLPGIDRSQDPDFYNSHYWTSCRCIMLSVLPSREDFARAHPEMVENFVADVIPQLRTEMFWYSKYTVGDIVNLIPPCIFAACGYDTSDEDLANDSAERIMNTYLPKYLSQPKPTENQGTPDHQLAHTGFTFEHQTVRAIVFELIKRYPAWIVTFHPEKVAALTDAVLQESSYNVIPKATALEMLGGLGTKLGESKSGELSSAFLEFFSDVIHLHKRVGDVQKNKQYAETSFDLAFNLAKQFPSLIRQSHESAFYFLNWAISMFIREPDATGVFDGIKDILTNEAVLPEKKHRKESDIVSLVHFITTLVELKHQALVLPQQTPVPSSQFAHISHHLAYVMVNKFGNYVRETKEKEYVWRGDFVALLDKLIALNDPQVKLESWSTETVSPK